MFVSQVENPVVYFASTILRETIRISYARFLDVGNVHLGVHDSLENLD